MDAVTRWLIIPEVTFSLLAILALLLLWQYHNNLVLTGRIYAIDFWDMSGIRMFLHASTLDGQACEVCREANGMVFLPSLALKNNFMTLPHPCERAAGCRCLLVGLYGGWSEANHVVERLRQQGRKKGLKLSEQELHDLLEGSWERSITGVGDELTIQMLKAISMEHQALEDEAAIVKYRHIISHAKGARDVRLIAPAFVRLSAVLERLARHGEAIAVIEEFEQRFPDGTRAYYFPSTTQRSSMAARKFRLQVNRKHEDTRMNSGNVTPLPSEASSAMP